MVFDEERGMNYSAIRTCDIADGPGVRVSLFVSGCTHCCKGCFNESTWDFAAGEPFTEETERRIFEACAPSHIAGLSLLGGEPFEPENQRALLPFLRKYIDAGVRNVLCTEISKDGTLSGPAIRLYQRVMEAYPTLHLIASGGVSSIDDIRALDAAGIPAVVFGKAIYEGRIDLNKLIGLMPPMP
jgi:hypothetical protein